MTRETVTTIEHNTDERIGLLLECDALLAHYRIGDGRTHESRAFSVRDD